MHIRRREILYINKHKHNKKTLKRYINKPLYVEEKMTETNNNHFWIYERIKEIDEEIAQKRREKAFLESLLQKDSPCIFKSKSSDTSIFKKNYYEI